MISLKNTQCILMSSAKGRRRYAPSPCKAGSFGPRVTQISPIPWFAYIAPWGAKKTISQNTSLKAGSRELYTTDPELTHKMTHKKYPKYPRNIERIGKKIATLSLGHCARRKSIKSYSDLPNNNNFPKNSCPVDPEAKFH